MALRLLLVVAAAAVAAASCRAGLADPAVSALPGLPVAGLAVGFYKESCPEVEDLVLTEMRAIVEKDRTLGPAMLRFMFHDCLVRVRLAPVSSFS
jgi:peroxidase